MRTNGVNDRCFALCSLVEFPTTPPRSVIRCGRACSFIAPRRKAALRLLHWMEISDAEGEVSPYSLVVGGALLTVPAVAAWRGLLRAQNRATRTPSTSHCYMPAACGLKQLHGVPDQLYNA